MKRTVVALVLTAFLAGCGGGSQAGASATVRGTVLAAPGCPVERVGSPCPALRVAGASVVVADGGPRVTTARSGRDGSFSLTVPPGTYRITATQSGGFRSSATQVIRVPEQGLVGVTITLDSGIR